MALVVGIFVLVPAYVTSCVNYVLPAGDTFAFSSFVKPLFVRACIFGRVSQAVYCRRGRWRLRYLESKIFISTRGKSSD